MNIFAWIILAALLFDSILNLTADVLNLKHLRNEVPPAFKGWYDADSYLKSQQYLRTSTHFGWITAGFDLLVLLAFWFSGGFAWLDLWVRGVQVPQLVHGLIYIGILVFAKWILSVPFDLYATFIIEERFGFNKTTPLTYILDQFKGIGLAVVLGGGLLAAVQAFFQYVGPNAWLFCWGVAVVFILIVQYIAPTWLMPLFNKFTPLPEGELRDAINEYAQRIGFKLENLYVMDGSKRSTRSNAFFTGFGRHRRIVLFDTLIEKHTTDELVAVLGHEMGHYKLKHILKMMAVGFLQTGLMFFILSLFISYPGLFQAFYVQEPSVYAGLIFFGMLFSPLGNFIGLIIQYVSRTHEYAADKFASATTGNGEAMIGALKRLSVDNLSNLEPHPFYVFLNYSHPPVLQRIAAIEASAGGQSL